MGPLSPSLLLADAGVRPARAVTAVARHAATELDEYGPWSFVKLVNGDSEVPGRSLIAFSAVEAALYSRDKPASPCVSRLSNLRVAAAQSKTDKDLAQATVYLRGAHVTSFKVAGVEWIGMRADCKLDGTKQNISGGLFSS